jgi:small conductance mechanosensitive channel
LFAAGGISLAVGFGAQSLIKDFLSGFFILLENQYVIGDRVEINGREGTVEDINLRTTIVREFNGDLFIIPNGEIRVVRNQTRNWSRVVMDIPVGYEADVDSVAELLQKAAAGMRQDENWRDKITEDAIFAGVQELAESAVIVRMLLKTLPGEQWGVAREYRRRAKVLLQEAGIEIPFPQRVLRHRYESSEERDEQKVKASTLEHKEHQVQDVSPEQGDRAEAIKQAAIKDEAANSSSRN